MAEYLKKVDLLAAAVEVEYLGRPRMMVSAAKIGMMPSIEAVPMEYHDKVCEEMARRHQAEILELTADRPQGEMIDISQEDFGTLCVCALRYCHGRQTYMPSLVQQIVTAHFKDLSDRDLQVIADDRQYQANMGLWGDACDKADWDRFYRALLKCQKERSR